MPNRRNPIDRLRGPAAAAALPVVVVAGAVLIGRTVPEERQIAALGVLALLWLGLVALVRPSARGRRRGAQIIAAAQRAPGRWPVAVLGVLGAAVVGQALLREHGKGTGLDAGATAYAIGVALTWLAAATAVGAIARGRPGGGRPVVAALVGALAAWPFVVWGAVIVRDADVPLGRVLALDLAGAAVATLALAVASARGPGTPGPSGGALALAAPALAVAGSAALLLGCVLVRAERLAPEAAAVARPGGDITLLTFPVDDDRALLQTYAPVLRLSPGELWPAGSAERYAERASVTVDDGVQEREGPPGPRVVDLTHGAVDGVIERGRLYPRIVALRPASACRAGRPCRLLDYWIFYPRNAWKAGTALGALAEIHHGDWEHVGVVIDGRRRPLLVAYSAHCGGSWRPWRSAPAVAVIGGPGARSVSATASSTDRTHPFVVVARGSHANYARTGRHATDWDCGGSAGGLGWMTGGLAAYERTPPLGVLQLPALADPARARAVLDAPWAWGSDARLHVNGIAIRRTRPHGPASPARTAGWADPARQIAGWRCEGSDGGECDRLRALLVG